MKRIYVDIADEDHALLRIMAFKAQISLKGLMEKLIQVESKKSKEVKISEIKEVKIPVVTAVKKK